MSDKLYSDTNLLQQTAQITLMAEAESESELSVHLTDDDEIRYLNRIYRNLDESTDVLAFSMREGVQLGNRKPETGNKILGDVIISVETAQRQAQEFKRSLRDELNHLLIHGILHLLGYDHKGKAETKLMREREWEILKRIKDERRKAKGEA